jgi:hypothetical protein
MASDEESPDKFKNFDDDDYDDDEYDGNYDDDKLVEQV